MSPQSSVKTAHGYTCLTHSLAQYIMFPMKCIRPALGVLSGHKEMRAKPISEAACYLHTLSLVKSQMGSCAKSSVSHA